MRVSPCHETMVSYRKGVATVPGGVPPVADERAGLTAYLAQQRLVLRIAAHGLSDEQARSTPSASALSIGGLLKHAARVERNWVDIILQRYERADVAREKSFQMGPDETLAGVLDVYDRAAAETDGVISDIPDLGQAVPVPRGVPWFPADVAAWSVRWVLLHLVSETARHAGHADIIRESIDGATAIPLMAAAENWPPTPWVRPWTPPAKR